MPKPINLITKFISPPTNGIKVVNQTTADVIIRIPNVAIFFSIFNFLHINWFILIVNIGTPINNNKTSKPTLSNATLAVIPTINKIIAAAIIATVVKAPDPNDGKIFFDTR